MLSGGEKIKKTAVIRFVLALVAAGAVHNSNLSGFSQGFRHDLTTDFYERMGQWQKKQI